MTTTIGRPIPAAMTHQGGGGWSVCTIGVYRRGAVVHRPDVVTIYIPTGTVNPVTGEADTKPVVQRRPACLPQDAPGDDLDPRSPRYPQVTVAWAAHLGSILCDDGCWPEDDE